jgi:hypothetical protein
MHISLQTYLGAHVYRKAQQLFESAANDVLKGWLKSAFPNVQGDPADDENEKVRSGFDVTSPHWLPSGGSSTQR